MVDQCITLSHWSVAGVIALRTQLVDYLGGVPHSTRVELTVTLTWGINTAYQDLPFDDVTQVNAEYCRS